MRSFITLAVLYAAFAAATPLPQISPLPTLGSVTELVDGILDALDGGEVSGNVLHPTRTTSEPAVDSIAGDAALERRQVGGVVQEVDDALLGAGLPLPSLAPVLPADLGLRQLGDGSGPLVDVDALVDNVLDDANIDALRLRSPGDLTLRQQGGEPLTDVDVLVTDVLDNLGVNALDRRQSTGPSLSDVDTLVTDVLDNLGVNALDRRQSPEQSLTDVDVLVTDVLDNLGVNALDRRQSTETLSDLVDELEPTLEDLAGTDPL